MHLSSPDTHSFALTILGYQFPHLQSEPFDSNWLTVGIEARAPEGYWQASDACLLTYEARELVSWLREAASHVPAENPLDFTEPTLRFEVETSPTTTLCVHLAYGFEPPWLRTSADIYNHSFTLRFPASPSVLLSAAEALAAQLYPFPQRASQ